MKTRTQYSVLNSTISSLIFLIKMFISFVLRSFFIQKLGVEYLGLNGLFTNVLSFLSLAELGIGTSIVFELYKPLASGDEKETVSLMALYKKVYHVIGLVVGVVGIALIPLLPFMIKGNSLIPGTTIFYLLFLANSVISYFFTYKRSLINADQHNYVTVLNDFLFYVIMTVLQIIILIVWHNYYLFLIVQVLSTLASNISISHIADKKYPFLKNKDAAPLDKDVVDRLKRNVIGNISSQIGTIVVLGSDNIIISGFIGLAVVGIYSNYTIITNALSGLANQVTNSVVSSVGNLVATGDEISSYNVFKLHLFITKSIAFFGGIGIYIFINPFITIWIGQKYILPKSSIFLIALYTVIFIYQGTSRTFINSYGLYWQQRWKSIIESIVNIVVSISLIVFFNMGLNGVLIGTIVSSVTVIMWFEPFVLYKFGFHKPMKSYFIDLAQFYLILCVLMYLMGKLADLFVVTNLLSFILWFVVGLALIIILYLLIFARKPEFKQVLARIKMVLKR